ncbi:hypothetical protein Lal_00022828 [Lupinus albus]|nr:hypothetical protein Lal_00022828 [Lupinus albus]
MNFNQLVVKNIGLIIQVQHSFLIPLCEGIEPEEQKLYAYTMRWMTLHQNKIKNVGDVGLKVTIGKHVHLEIQKLVKVQGIKVCIKG